MSDPVLRQLVGRRGNRRVASILEVTREMSMRPLSLSQTSVALLFSLLLNASGVPALAQQVRPPMGLRVFSDNGFRGMTAGFVRDTPDLTTAGLEGSISSLQVADGEVWEICTAPRFGGRCRTVNGEINDLRRGGWNDVVLSVRRLRGGGARSFNPPPMRPSVSGLHLYGDINRRGTSATLTSDAPDLEQQGMARMVSSLELDADEVWEVCTEAGFRGRCMIVRESISDLRRGSWNDVIVSARRVRGPAPTFGGPRQPGGLEVFADINFRGRAVALGVNTPDASVRGLSGISSLRVMPGQVWEVCAETNFRGRCDIAFEDVPDLRRGGWNDLIASARRVR